MPLGVVVMVDMAFPPGEGDEQADGFPPENGCRGSGVAGVEAGMYAKAEG